MAGVVHDSQRLPIRWLLAVLVLALLAACSSPPPRGRDGGAGAPGQSVVVQEQWSENRRVTGHQTHVVEQRLACNRCHELKPGSVGSVSPARCAACHEAESHIEHAVHEAEQRLGPGVRADCLNCHAFTNDGLPNAASDGGARPADDGGVLTPYAPRDCARCHARAQGSVSAIVVHASAPCVSCHRPHQDQKPVAGPCVDCHRAISTTHAALGKSPNGVCTTCHTEQHAPASAARVSCAECHSKTQPLVPATALFAGGHSQCVGCHRPHEFEKSRAVPCRSCHAAVVVLAQAKVPAHAVCTNCHSPHDVRATPAAACAMCHQDVHPTHPDHVAGTRGGCLTCHDPHPASELSTVIARPCSSCHQAAATEQAFHSGVLCQKCHTPHRFALNATQHDVCLRCHQQELSLVSLRVGHSACQSCHAGLPHQPTVNRTACATCHAKESHAAREGHQVCTSCHQPHSGGIWVDCKTCHSSEFASAPSGHRACTNCHEPHTGSTSALKCSTCHAPEAATPHGKLATGCLGCHRPHGPAGPSAPPPCTSCHALAQLPGLHQKTPKHQACRTCHGGHGDAPDLERVVCMTCHTDRKDHFPGARCANCHLFQNGSGLKAR